MVKFIARLILLALFSVAIYYFMPANLQDNVRTALAKIMPEALKERIEPIIYSPEKRRERLISSLESDLEDLENFVLGQSSSHPGVGAPNTNELTSEGALKKLEEATKSIEKLKELNDESGIVNQITDEVVDKVIASLNLTAEDECSCDGNDEAVVNE